MNQGSLVSYKEYMLSIIKTIENESIDFFLLHPKQEHYFISNNKQKITVLDHNFDQISSFNLLNQYKELASISPYTGDLGFIDNDTSDVNIYNYKGDHKISITGNYSALSFDSKGYLWLIERLNETLLVASVYDENYKLIDSIHYQDDLWESSIMIKQVSYHDVMIVEHAAGQDGCDFYEFSLNDHKLEYKKSQHKGSLAVLTFNNVGDKYLAVDNDDFKLYHYSYPDHKYLGHFEINEDDSISYSLVYLKSKAIFSTINELYYVLDLKTMTVLEEFELPEYKNILIRDKYKNLDEDGVVSRLNYLIDSINYVMAVSDKEELIILKKS